AEELASLRGGRAQAGRAGTRARDVPYDASAALELAVPDAASVAGGRAALVRVLKLQIARGHVLAGPDVFFGVLDLVMDVVLVDDHEAESLEQPALEALVH